MADYGKAIFTEEQVEAKIKQVLLQGGGIPPGGSGSMEARIAKLEASVGHIERDISEMKADIRDIKKEAKNDFKLLFAAIIFVALGLAGLMAKGFHWL
ncbi:MAG: hypothetical protein AAGU11_15465 [Syntrophobacteraceae bacterium]